MNKTNISFKIIKFIVIIGCCIGVVFRISIPDQYINYYMAGVNVLSFFIAINLLLMECYVGLKKEYKDKRKELEINVIRAERVKNGIRKFFLGIFGSNVIMVVFLIGIYGYLCKRMAVLNDILGIFSLGLAVSSDLIEEIVVGVLMWRLENKE